jgi:hypothetical protein
MGALALRTHAWRAYGVAVLEAPISVPLPRRRGGHFTRGALEATAEEAGMVGGLGGAARRRKLREGDIALLADLPVGMELPRATSGRLGPLAWAAVGTAVGVEGGARAGAPRAQAGCAGDTKALKDAEG